MRIRVISREWRGHPVGRILCDLTDGVADALVRSRKAEIVDDISVPVRGDAVPQQTEADGSPRVSSAGRKRRKKAGRSR